MTEARCPLYSDLVCGGRRIKLYEHVVSVREEDARLDGVSVRHKAYFLERWWVLATLLLLIRSVQTLSADKDKADLSVNNVLVVTTIYIQFYHFIGKT